VELPAPNKSLSNELINPGETSHNLTNNESARKYRREFILFHAKKIGPESTSTSPDTSINSSARWMEIAGGF
jgi:hypothetical protein